MDASAKPFVFNPSSTSWAPPAPAPPPVTEAVTEDEGDDEQMDADDPLWLAVLKLAGGDAKKANQMLEDPDALMAYPEVAALLTGGGAEEGAWDADEADEEVAALPPPAPKTAKAAKADSRPPTPTDDDQSHGSHDDHDDSATLGEEDPREHLNVVFIGHVDAGKSTLSGNILYLTGYVDKRTIEKYEREAKQRNRESWFLAFIMDTNEEERAKGKTVEVGRAPFATAAKRYTILDAPGHKNYVPHMISGAAQADVGILVISARRGEFETGFERGGQTREHAMLAKTLGVRYLVVVINKMDDATVNWSKDRFDECVSKLKPFLKTCGYIIKSEVKFLPISGLSGANVLVQVPTEQCNWWQECVNAGENNTADPTLIQCLDALSLTGRSADSPLRIPVLDRFYERGTICMGKVESGRVRKGDVLTIMPTKVTCKVEQIYVNETEPVVSAKPGENINMKLSGINVEDISKGFVICGGPTQRRCHAVTTFTCQLALVELLEHRPIFTAGYTCMLHAHTCESEVAVAELISQVNAKGKGPQRALHFAKMGALIICKLTVPQTICLEVYDDMAFLGRFTLRDEGKTIAIGKVLSFDD